MSYDQRIADLESRIEELERLKGMQGPEQGLVGESRSARKQGHAEEAKPGERGVGEIVELAELRRYFDRDFNEALRQQIVARLKNDAERCAYLAGEMAGLARLLYYAESTAEKRSDLSNV